MNLARSTYYDEPAGQPMGEAKVAEKIEKMCSEYPRYGYRRVTAQLRRDGVVVNHKRAMRIMREQGLSVRPHRRFVATTDSNHGGPIFPNLARGLIPAGPNELWVADLTFIAIARGSVYLVAVLDAWSRRVVGYALGRAIDARLTLAALRSAIANRQPKPGCVHHSDRGYQYAADQYRAVLAEHGLRGSMGRRGVPYDNAKAESFMKTLKTGGGLPRQLKETYPHQDHSRLHASWRTSTTNAGSTQHSDIGALSSSRTNTPTRLSIQHPNPCSPPRVQSKIPCSAKIIPCFVE